MLEVIKIGVDLIAGFHMSPGVMTGLQDRC